MVLSLSAIRLQTLPQAKKCSRKICVDKALSLKKTHHTKSVGKCKFLSLHYCLYIRKYFKSNYKFRNIVFKRCLQIFNN